ncbi:hypothetical protein HMPREF9081_1720 [Centipeda periodontii DSM 2778]|uniref:rRNA biogenesis protein rrp5 n=1 Tax=Centipeda periodontii DSM 2778 TaxID=888060 RepID=F5RN84_9FIRM|nr:MULTISPECIES: hypothetical protein [Selenomonadaceae]EGK59216.1 hypothetical protein HMPREF9081_1720 [Centipeda periodontii DSM 2778]
MDKMQEISAVIEGIAECGNGLLKISETLRRYFNVNAEDEPKKKSPAKKKAEPPKEEIPPVEEQAPTPKEPEYTKEYVRKLLADIANNGQREKVKEIINKHGANSLSAVDPGEYAAIVAEAEVLLNA